MLRERDEKGDECIGGEKQRGEGISRHDILGKITIREGYNWISPPPGRPEPGEGDDDEWPPLGSTLFAAARRWTPPLLEGIVAAPGAHSCFLIFVASKKNCETDKSCSSSSGMRRGQLEPDGSSCRRLVKYREGTVMRRGAPPSRLIKMGRIMRYETKDGPPRGRGKDRGGCVEPPAREPSPQIISSMEGQHGRKGSH